MANDGTMPVDAALVAAARREDRSPRSAHRAVATILVVEDDADIRALAVEYLTIAGYRVLSAGDGSAAMATLESGVAVDLVFSDIVMPGGLSGTELAARARRLRPGIKVVLTSGYAQHPAAQPATLGEVDGFLAKPYRRRELAAQIRAVLAD
jgi:CheY-like chemotaxis protein